MYSIRKSRHILRERIIWYRRHWRLLEQSRLGRFERLLDDLDKATLAKDRERSDALAHELEALKDIEQRKPFVWYIGELLLAIVVALVVATCVRVMWFEPYKIPTGSMRPTYAEQDHLIVSKTAFGLNVPLRTEHFYFDPSLVKRSDVIVWSGENIDLPDTDTVYFWLFPGKKRYIKRLMGLPGDSLYFYGGRIYGVDKDGNDVSAELSLPGNERIDHIPFNTFEGRLSVGHASPSSSSYEVTLRQMNRPVGRFSFSSYGVSDGQVFNGHDWIKDNPQIANKPHDTVQTYTDFLGMRNFAMARLLTKQQVKAFAGIDPQTVGEGLLYLELRHNPNLANPKPRVGEGPVGQVRVALTPFVTVIPLQEQHLKGLMDAMYTSRFVVKNGFAAAWQIEGTRLGTGSPEMPGVPDGDYEFYYGKAYELSWGGIRTELPSTHPLYQVTAKNVQLLFNLGVEFNTAFSPWSPDQLAFPSRYAYFREGDLYVMGAPLLTKGDATLDKFVADEAKHESSATQAKPYIAFKDYGPPIKDGMVDTDYIRAFGVTLPDNYYMVLGDNHARSADSRTFGFIPQENIQGAPFMLIWPTGGRWGFAHNPSMPWITLPGLIIWSIVAVLLAIWVWREHRLNTRPIFQKKSV